MNGSQTLLHRIQQTLKFSNIHRGNFTSLTLEGVNMSWSPMRQNIRGSTKTTAAKQQSTIKRLKRRRSWYLQARTKEVASLTDADVIVFVNNTQLDAGDVLCLPKAPPCTQRAGTPSAIEPRRPDPSAVSSCGRAAVWMLLLPQPNT